MEAKDIHKTNITLKHNNVTVMERRDTLLSYAGHTQPKDKKNSALPPPRTTKVIRLHTHFVDINQVASDQVGSEATVNNQPNNCIIVILLITDTP